MNCHMTITTKWYLFSIKLIHNLYKFNEFILSESGKGKFNKLLLKFKLSSKTTV